MFSLKDQLIIISGASSGIGKACALACDHLGANLALFGRDMDRLSAVKAELTGDDHFCYAFDIGDSQLLELKLKETFEQMGPFNGFIHSAGIQKTLPLKLTDSKVFSDQYRVNVIAGFDLVRIVLRKKYFHSHGSSLVFIASINGVIGAGAQIAYSASKGAVIAAVRSLALELAPQNIRVNSISPGMVDRTQMTDGIVKMLSKDWEQKNRSDYPLGWVEPEDVANAATFLLSNSSKKITGTNLIVDGGYSVK